MTPDLPALLGGPPVRPQGPPDWPTPDDDVLQALQAAYRDGSWGKYQGPHVERLEQRLAQLHGVDFALTCASGTFAVELALRALKVDPGDEVILAAYDYPGNFLSVHAVGARPVLVDLDPANWNLDPGRLANAIGPATRAIIVSHLHGGVVPMRAVTAVANAHGLKVIEDACQAPGALIEGRKAGTWGDVGILSFGGSKLLSAGRGGALVTRQADVHQRARTWNSRGNLLAPLSELQAAVLLPQLDKLDVRNARRTENVLQLVELLQSPSLEKGGQGGVAAFRPLLLESTPPAPPSQGGEKGLPGIGPLVNRCDCKPGYYKLGLQLDCRSFGLARERLVAAMRAEGIALDEGFQGLHVGRSPRRFRPAGALAEADRAHEGMVVLHHPVLLGRPADIEEVARALHKVHASAARLSE